MSNSEIEKSDVEIYHEVSMTSLNEQERTKLDNWLDTAVERIKNMSREELIFYLDKHSIQYKIKEKK